MHGTWNNGAVWGLANDGGATYGVLIAPDVQGLLVDGVTGGSRLASPGNIVAQQGPPDPTNIVVNSPGSTLVMPGPGYGLPNPQGRLTLQSRTAVMSSPAVAQSTIYYDCYNGPNVPFFNGGSDQLDSIAACEISVPLVAPPNPGMENANDVFDVWWWHNGGSPAICVATNGLGAGWTGDGGSLNARGSGYTQLRQASLSSRGYITNKNAFTHAGGAYCDGLNNGSLVDFVSMAPGQTIPAGQLTYLGSFYTTAGGQTSFNPTPSAASGSPGMQQAQVGICNAYNQVPVSAAVQDIHAAYTVGANNTWEVAGAAHSGVNNMLVLDCLQSIPWNAQLSQPVTNGGASSGGSPKLSFALVPLSTLSSYTSGTQCTPFTTPTTSAAQQAASVISVSYSTASLPILGATCAQAIEFATNNSTTFFNPALQIQLPWDY